MTLKNLTKKKKIVIVSVVAAILFIIISIICVKSCVSGNSKYSNVIMMWFVRGRWIWCSDTGSHSPDTPTS